MNKKTDLLLVTVLLLMVSVILGTNNNAQAAVEIVNGDFELPANTPWAHAEAWNGVCNVNIQGTGQKGNNAETKDATSFVYQDLIANVVAGRRYTLSFYRKQPGAEYHNGDVSMDAQLIFGRKIVASTGPITREQVKPFNKWIKYNISYQALPEDDGKPIRIAFDVKDISDLTGKHGSEKYGHAYAVYDSVVLSDGTPFVEKISPLFADAEQGSMISITGRDLDEVTQVSLGSIKINKSDFKAQDKNKIVVFAPPHTEGKIKITVITSLGSFTYDKKFMYRRSEIYYVSTKGADSYPGTKVNPFNTIQKAASTMKKGDTCYVRGGRYYEEVHCESLEGISFIAYPGENVIFDGTESISNLKKDDSNWTTHSSSIYKIKLDQDIWQFFYQGKMMTAARWPNDDITLDAAWTKKDKRGWAFGIGGKDYAGYQYTDTSNGRPSLAATDKDFTGARGIMNLGAWLTLVTPVISHTAGSDEFTYNPKLFDSWAYKTSHVIKSHSYYLECHLSALDIPGEWYYNHATNELYFMSPDGNKPYNTARGRVRDFAFSGRNNQYLTLKGFRFIGCTVNFENCEHLTIEDCDFVSASYSKRMLGKTQGGSWTFVKGPRTGSYNTFRNCTFIYCDGAAIKLEGQYDLVDNVLIHHCDWSVVQNAPIEMRYSSKSTVRRVTVYNTGSSEGIQVGLGSLVELCDFGRGIGGLEDDGACIQVSPPEMYGTIIRYNWVHDNDKFGIRGDFYPSGVYGSNMTVHHNVVWGLEAAKIHPKPAIHMDGDGCYVYNNLSFHNTCRDICLPIHTAEWNNSETITRNNCTGPAGIGEGRTGKDNPPGIVNHNIEYPNESNMPVMNQNTCDFRPKKFSRLVDAGAIIPGITDGYLGKAPDIGPYEYGAPNYWIPGYQTKKASKPIPPQGAKHARLDGELIWLVPFLKS